MQVIYELLLDRKYPNAVQIAMDLEVSPATAKRDIEFMRDRWGLPIEYHPGRHGYYFSQAVSQPHARPLSQAELFALRLAHGALKQYQAPSLDRPLENAIQRLSEATPDGETSVGGQTREAVWFRPSASEQAGEQAFDLLMRAITQGRGIAFEYRKPGEARPELRQVHPYHILGFENRWYLLGLDLRRGEVRKFALTRMSRLRFPAGERFRRPVGFNPEEYLGRSFGIMTGAGDYEVAIEMDRWLTDVLRGQHWHSSQAWIELPDGSSYLRFRVSCLEEIERWVLSWGIHATVVRPIALAARLGDTAKALVQKYGWARSGSDSVEAERGSDYQGAV
jgi:predicted DNA-binding transcriptional regulator YafY